MDSKIEFNELCRLCLARKHVNIHIFEGEGCKAGIFLKISTCLPVNISLEDKLPKRICSNCFTKLNTLYQFYNKAVNSEKQLLEWFNECATENDNETFLDNNVDTEMSQDNSEVEVKEEELSFLPEEDNYNIKLEEVNVQDNMLQDIPHEINEMSHEKCSDIIESKAVTNGEVDTLKYEDVEDGSSVTPNSLRNEINSKYAKNVKRPHQRTTKRQQWTEEALRHALENIFSKKMSMNRASREFGIPSRTLRRYVASRKLKTPLGRSRLLGIEQEKKLVQHIKALEKIGFAPGQKGVRMIAYEFAEKLGIKHTFSRVTKSAGYDWFRGFNQRNKLNLPKLSKFSVERLHEITRKDIEEYFSTASVKE